MSSPRYFPEESHTFSMVRSTHNDQNRFVPNEETNNKVSYYAGFEAERNLIDLNLLILMSHQYCLIGTTRSAESDVPKFAQNFHSILARDMNQVSGSSGYFWRDKSYHHQVLHDQEDLLEIAARAITKPVRDGLVDDPSDWLGISINVEETEFLEIDAIRPDFCGRRSRKPAEITIRFHRSPLMGRNPAEIRSFVTRLRERVRIKTAEYIAQRGLVEAQQQVTPLSPEEQLLIDPDTFRDWIARDATPSENAYDLHCALSEAHNAYSLRVSCFRRAYRHAFRTWQQTTDKNSIVFPVGTYKMRVIHGIPCTGIYQIE